MATTILALIGKAERKQLVTDMDTASGPCTLRGITKMALLLALCSGRLSISGHFPGFMPILAFWLTLLWPHPLGLTHCQEKLRWADIVSAFLMGFGSAHLAGARSNVAMGQRMTEGPEQGKE